MKKASTEQKEDKFKFVQIPKDVLHDKRLSLSSKILQGYFIFRTGENQVCWPGYDLIQKDLGLSRDAINRSRKQLIKTGWLKYIRGKRGSRGSNRYYPQSKPKIESQSNQTVKSRVSPNFRLTKSSKSAKSGKIVRKPYKVSPKIRPNISPKIRPYIVRKSDWKRTSKRKAVKEKENIHGFSSSDSFSKTQKTFEGDYPEEIEAILEKDNPNPRTVKEILKEQMEMEMSDTPDTPNKDDSEYPQICEKCGAPTVQRTSHFGKFTGCSRYPKCKWVYGARDKKSPVEEYEEEEDDFDKSSIKKPYGLPPYCPRCNAGDMVPRSGGKFWGCSNYPNCKYTWNEKGGSNG